MAFNLLASLLATAVRGTPGISSEPAVVIPRRMLQLYDIENCPYCRLVREVLTELALDVEIYPCPKNGERYRPQVLAAGGKAQFPYLVDPNTGIAKYESLEIITYLFETYGAGAVPLKWRAGAVQTFGSMLASAARMNRGMHVRTGKLPEYMLELYSFESSPYARPVRELLCELEIPYILRNCGRTELQEWIVPPLRKALDIQPESTLENRRRLQEEEGRVAIPYLYDPNTEQGLFESAAILEYLEVQYAA